MSTPTFSPTTRPERAGVYFNIQGKTPPPNTVATSGVVAVPFVRSWGPANIVGKLTSVGGLISTFGPEIDGAYAGIFGALKGEGVEGGGGALQVLGYRITPADATVATLNLANTAGTPVADAVTLKGKYKGALANTFTVTKTAKAGSSTIDVLNIAAPGMLPENYEYAKADMVTLAAKLNKFSNLVTMTVKAGAEATALANVTTPTALSGGANGTVTVGDYTAMLQAFQYERFGLMAPANLTDAPTIAALQAWTADRNSKGQRFMLVIGGGLSDDSVTAGARSNLANNPDIVNLGVGTYSDENLPGLTLSTAALAPRLAGILARKGETSSGTYARMQGLTILSGADEAAIKGARTDGYVVLSRDADPEAPVFVERALTTFTATNDPDRPVELFRNPKFVRTTHGIQNEVTAWAARFVIGRMPINDATRKYVVSKVKDLIMRPREESTAIQIGWSVAIAEDIPVTPQDDFIALTYTLDFGRTVDQLLNTLIVG